MASQAQGDQAHGNTSLQPKAIPPYAGPGGPPWQFWALHFAALILLLPVVGATRLLPGHRHEHSGESIFAETNRTVLTALGTAFML